MPGRGAWLSQGTFNHTSFCRAGKRYPGKQARRADYIYIYIYTHTHTHTHTHTYVCVYVCVLSTNWDLDRKSSVDAPWWQATSLKGLSDQCRSLLLHPSCEPGHCPHSTQLIRTILQVEHHVPSPLIHHFPALSAFIPRCPDLFFSTLILFFKLDAMLVLPGTTLFPLDTDPEKLQLQLPPQLSKPALGPCSLGHGLSWLPSTLPVQLGSRQHKALADGWEHHLLRPFDHLLSVEWFCSA